MFFIIISDYLKIEENSSIFYLLYFLRNTDKAMYFGDKIGIFADGFRHLMPEAKSRIVKSL